MINASPPAGYGFNYARQAKLNPNSAPGPSADTLRQLYHIPDNPRETVPVSPPLPWDINKTTVDPRPSVRALIPLATSSSRGASPTERKRSRDSTPNTNYEMGPSGGSVRNEPGGPSRPLGRIRGCTPVGLTNLGNTCFMNASLQCLLNTESLQDYFVNQDYKKDINRTKGMKGQLAEAFGELMNKMRESTSSVSPTRLKTFIGSWASAFQGYRQHDAQEFLRFLLDGLHEDLNRVTGRPVYHELQDIDGEPEEITAQRWSDAHKARNDSYIMDVFCGQLRSRVTCLRCQNTSKAFDPFMDLSLTIPTNMSHNITLQDCLYKFTQEETLTGSEKYYCPKCKKHQDSVKRMDIWRLPPVLVLHLKRFCFTGFGRKIVQDVKFFPKQLLDMSPFCSESLTINGQRTEGRYQLYGVVNHIGGMGGGHYVAVCRTQPDSQWYEFDDSHVTRVDEDHLGGPASYVLFYSLISCSDKTQNQ